MREKHKVATLENPTGYLEQWGHTPRLPLAPAAELKSAIDKLGGIALHSERLAPYTRKRIEEEEEKKKSAATRSAFAASANARMAARFGKLWRVNWASNWARVAPLPGVKHLFRRMDGIPAVICSAGPSLERALPLLKEYQGGYLVVAVDAAYQRLRDAGVKPDITISSDVQKHAAKFLENHRKGDLVAMCPAQSPDLVNSVPITDSVFYSQKKGLRGADSFWDEVVKHYFGGREGYFGVTFSGGTVTTDASCLTFLMGCDPILHVGLNLCFGTAGERRNQETLIPCRDMNGDKVLSMSTFLGSRDWLEWAMGGGWLGPGAPRKNARWINATGAGMLTKSCELINPEDAIPQLAGPRIRHDWHLRKHLEIITGRRIA